MKLADFIGATTTLFFWGIGDIFIDWYLTFLIYLYLSFPILYKIVSKYGFLGVLIVSMVSLCGVWHIPTVWFQESAFCRIPIFLSGIYLYTAANKRNALLFLLVFFGLLTVISYVSGNVCMTYYLAPFMISIIMIVVYLANRLLAIKNILEFIGKHTLELYVANCIVMELMKFVPNHGIIGYAFYFIGTFLLGAMLYLLLGCLKRG